MEKLKTLEQTTCFIKLQADSKTEIFESRIGKNRFGAYDLRKFLNDFPIQLTERPQAFIKFADLEEMEIDFKTVTFPGKTFWKGYLKPGIPNQLGVKLEITITEIRQDSTNCYCYGITIQMSLKEEKKNSEYALKLFGMDDKPGKKSKKKRGGKL
jgi:hypothetical protein